MPKKEPINIDNLQAGVGQKIFDFVNITDNLGTISQLPVGIINGTGVGPTLLITAGIHGCEYVGIEGATRIYREVIPEGLNGSVIVINCMNLPAFRMGTPFVVPFDNKNLNRVFPGNKDGSASEIIANTVMLKFLPESDYLVDCHSGDIGEILFPITICNQTENATVSRKSKELANAFGLDYSLYHDIRSGDDGTWVAKTNLAGVPAIFAEVGCNGGFDECDVNIHVRGLKNVMKYLGMIPGKIERESDKDATTYFRYQSPIRAQTTGIFNPRVRTRDRISKGQILAEITNIKGDVIDTVIANEDGLLWIMMTKRFVNNDDILFYALIN